MRGLPGLRGVRRARRDPQRPGHDAGRAAPRAGAGGEGRCAPPRLHALPVPRPHDQRRDGPRRRARRLRRRDRLRGAPPPRGHGAGARPERGSGHPPLALERRRRPVPAARPPAARPRARRGRRRSSGPEAAQPPAERSRPGWASRRGLEGCRHDRHPPGRPCRRPAPSHHLRARLHDDGGRLVPRHLRRHPGALHGLDRRGRAPLDARQGQGLGHGRVLDAARLLARADPARGQGRQAVGPHPGDPAPHRSLAAGGVRHARPR